MSYYRVKYPERKRYNKKHICDLHQQGKSIKEICEIIGCGETTARRYSPNPPKTKDYVWRNSILELRKQGKKPKEIQKILNCNIKTVYYHCHYHNPNSLGKRISQQYNHPYYQKMITFTNARYDHKYKNRTRHKILYQKLCQFWGDNVANASFKVKNVVEKFSEEPVCYLTGDKIDIMDSSSYTFDHIQPKCKDGDNDITNLGLATKAANSAKNDMSYDEFIEFCKKVITYHEFKEKNNIPLTPSGDESWPPNIS